ncbi:MAG: thiopurine S-methyltransferase [Balneolaceae bacterium]|nr:thiopurine S-methyltransferase [Balneolaceae bacterium]
MELSYWRSRWQNNKTGWHLDQVYPPLKSNWQRLSVSRGGRALVPLCGMSHDLRWLAEQGVQVTGVEISELAIRRFFEEAGREYQTRPAGSFTIYESGNIKLWQGDFLSLEPEMLPAFNLIYDRAALVALPRSQRKRYAGLIREISTETTEMLLSSFEYPQEEMNGPPFAVWEDEIHAYYGQRFHIELVSEESMLEHVPKFRQRGLSSHFTEKVYLLKSA